MKTHPQFSVISELLALDNISGCSYGTVSEKDAPTIAAGFERGGIKPGTQHTTSRKKALS